MTASLWRRWRKARPLQPLLLWLPGIHVDVLAAILSWKPSGKRSLETSAVVSSSNTSEALNSPPTVRLHHPTAQTASLSICLAEVQLDPDKGGNAPAAGEGRTPAGSFQDFKCHASVHPSFRPSRPSRPPNTSHPPSPASPGLMSHFSVSATISRVWSRVHAHARTPTQTKVQDHQGSIGTIKE